LNRRTPLPVRLKQMLQSPDERHVAITIGNEKSASRKQYARAFSTDANRATHSSSKPRVSLEVMEWIAGKSKGKIAKTWRARNGGFKETS